MPANPTTDQYLAVVRTSFGGSCPADCEGTDHVIVDRIVKALAEELPGIGPGTIGQVMLHMSMIQSELGTSHYTFSMPPANRSRFVINCTALAAAQLITGVDYTRAETG